jgi:hypothetical protein
MKRTTTLSWTMESTIRIVKKRRKSKRKRKRRRKMGRLRAALTMTTPTKMGKERKNRASGRCWSRW